MTDINLEIPNVLDATTLLWFENLSYETQVNLLTSLLKKNIDVNNITFNNNIKSEYVSINNLIFLSIKSQETYFNIYPDNINIMHLIINHNLSFNKTLNFCIYMFYWNYGGNNSIDINNFDIKTYINELVYVMCSCLTLDNIIFKYDYDYKKLLYNKCNRLMTNNDKSILDLEIKLKHNYVSRNEIIKLIIINIYLVIFIIKINKILLFI